MSRKFYCATLGRMTGTPERLRFAVRFATMDLDAARPGDVLNLRADIADFLDVDRPKVSGAPAGSWIPEPDPPPSKLSDEDLRNIQGGIKLLLEYIADKQAGKRTGAPWFEIATRKTINLAEGGGLLYRVQAKPDDLFFEVLFRHLEQAGSLKPILRCPECPNLFYRVRKQKYCGSKCVKKANWRAYVKTSQGKAAKKRADRKRRLAVKQSRSK